jgi:hypothetical protein
MRNWLEGLDDPVVGFGQKFQEFNKPMGSG